MSAISKLIASVKTTNCVACGTCYAVCPFDAIDIYKGCYAQPDEAKCIGCGTCARSCPTGCITIKAREVQA